MNRAKITLDFIETEQPVGIFYTCVMKAQSLLEICTFDFRKIESNNGIKEFLGIQRKLKQDRVREIRKYISTEDASFPTSIVISVDERCAEFVEIDGSKKLLIRPFEDPSDKSEIVPFRGIATIIDGQHRLKAFDETTIDWDLSVNILIGASPGTQAMIFSKVNLAQTKVNKSLVYDLFSLDRDRSPEKTAHEIVVNLNDLQESPFFERIKRLGSATDGVFGETLSQATVVKGLLPYITQDPLLDRDIGRRSAQWPDKGQKDFQRRIFYPFFRQDRDEDILAIIINYFNAVQRRWPSAWAYSGTGSVLPKTNGYNGLIRFLRDAYLYVTASPRVVSEEEFYSIFRKSDLQDNDFTTEKFVPGSSGSAHLYAELNRLIQ